MKKILLILFCILISVPAILPFFHPGYFPTHDGEWAVVRLTDMFRILRDFQFPARYSENLNFGYGYPLFNFVYPLPYYLGIFIYMFGLGFVGAIKTLFIGSVLLSAMFMFLASRALWKSTWAGIISAMLYIYFPYRMVDLYVRGSVGESLAFILFPLLFYLAVKLIARSSLLLIVSVAISIASLIMTHNIMTVLFMPLYIVFILIQILLRDKKAIKPFFISIVLGFGLSAFFWIPALFEKGNILLSQTPIASRNLYFVTFKQFIFSRWGYGVPTDPNGFSYQLGPAHLAVIIIVALYSIFALIKSKKHLIGHSVKIAGSLTIIVAFYIFLLFKPSDFLWKNTPLLSEINYPWIVLGILGFLISLSAGFLCRQRMGRCAMVFLSIIAVLTVFPYAKPQYYINRGDNYYLTNNATTTSSGELMPLWVKKIPVQRWKEKIEIINGEGVLRDISYNSKMLKFSIDALSQSTIRVNTIYYPGWNVLVDGINVPISYANEKGAMDISVNSGNHIVRMNFGETQLRLISDIISLASIAMLLLLIIRRNKYEFF
ncbi:MAG: hypothetical protein Q7K54_00765 [Candidatus Parcubacteria bacterium]|nr:hypothetical protein [Candidatus Parcubacteria bacterium]